MSMPEAKIRWPSLSRRKLVLRAMETAIGGAGEVADKRARDPRIEHHRHAPGRDLARIEPRYRALAGGAADRFGGFEVGGMQRRGVIVILLHAGAVAGDRRHGNGMPRADGGAVKAVARHQHHAADPGRGRGAARFGDAGNAEPGRFGLPRPLFQHFHRGHVGIEQVEIGESIAPTAPDRRGRRICPRARRAPWRRPARPEPSTPSPRTSLVEIDACLWPTMTRKPTSSPSARCDSSTAPSRTSTESETERTATASA